MKFILRLIALASVLAASTAVQASQTYDYSYTFNTGDVISGSFTGDANGNLINNLSNITASLDGTAFNGSGNLYGSFYTDAGGDCSTCWSAGGAVVSFDGTQNNFLFIDSNYPTDPNFTNYFYVIPWPNGANNPEATQAVTPAGILDNYNGNYIVANWSVEAVPEPESIALLGLGLMALVVARKKGQKQS